jgi:hypothetical protein
LGGHATLPSLSGVNFICTTRSLADLTLISTVRSLGDLILICTTRRGLGLTEVSRHKHDRQRNGGNGNSGEHWMSDHIVPNLIGLSGGYSGAA